VANTKRGAPKVNKNKNKNNRQENNKKNIQARGTGI